MKTKIKRHSRSVISVLLAVCMIISCMTVGIIATDAAYDSSESVGNNEAGYQVNIRYLYINMNTAGSTLNGIGLYWQINDTGDGAFWLGVDKAEEVETGIYKFDLNDTGNSSYSYLRKVRVNSYTGNKSTWYNANVNGDGSSTTDMITVDSGKTSGTWSTYTPAATTTTLTTPTIAFDNSGAVNSGDSAILRVSNHQTITGQNDSTMSYKLYKNGTEMSSGYSYSNGVFTITSYANGDSFTVQAVTGNTDDYADSEESDEATLTVYEPKYALLGCANSDSIENIINSQASHASTKAYGWPTTPVDDETHFNSTVVVNEVTSTPGVYKITFTTKAPNWDINIGLYQKTVGQRGFSYDGTDYTSPDRGKELKVPSAGLSNVGIIDGTSSMQFKPNITYTITIDQRGATDVLSITSDAADITAIARVKTFNPTTGALNTSVSNATAAVGTATASPSAGKVPFTSTLTAEVADSTKYDFAGWYTDANCTTPYDANATTTANVSTDVTYYALFTQKTPDTVNLTIDTTGSGTVTPTSGTQSGSGSSYTIYPGATVVFTATPGENYGLDTVTSTSGTVTKSGNTVTVSNITEAATVSFTFTEVQTYNVTLQADSSTYGSLTATYVDRSGSSVTTSAITGSETIAVKQGEVVSLKATAGDSGNFDGWTVNSGTYQRSSLTPLSAAEVNIMPTSDLSMTANFSQIVTTTTAFYTDIWTGNTSVSNVPMKQYPGSSYDNRTDLLKATVTLTAGTTYNIQFKYNNSTVLGNNQGATSWNYYTSWNNNQHNTFTPSATGTYTILAKLDGTRTDQIQAILLEGDVNIISSSGGDDTPDVSRLTKLYVLDGIDMAGNVGTNSFGDSTIISANSGVVKYNYYDATGADSVYSTSTGHSEGGLIYYYDPTVDLDFRVQTTIASGHRALGVRAFVMNGMTYPAKKDKDGNYYADITLDANTTTAVLEVIPVYYNKLIEANGDYIKFYVDANTIGDKFGKTIGYSVWYKNTSLHGETGGYPGQPLLSDGTLLYGYFPKYYVDNDATTIPAAADRSAFAGVLLSNLAEHNDTHKAVLTAWGASTANYQSFDYEDPEEIAKIADVDTIEFVAKYKELTTKHRYDSSYNARNLNGKTGKSWPASITRPTSAATALSNGFEYLTNIDGKRVNIFNETGTLTGDPLYVVSVGNQQVSPNDWDTVWEVYTASGNSIAAARPVDFINPSNELRTALANYTNSPVLINYEGWLAGENNTGTRLDGRWLYSKSTDDTTLRLRVATKDNSGNLTFMMDGITWAEISNGTINGSLETADDTNLTKILNLDDRTTEVTAKINPVGYTVEGMYMLGAAYSDDANNGYSTKISDYDDMNVTGTATSFVNSKDNRMVIVVKRIPATDLVITHQMYGGPGAHKIKGFYYVKAELLNSGGTTVKTYNSGNYTNKPLTLSSFTTDAPKNGGYKLKVTIRTVMSGSASFNQWYENDHNNGYDEIDSTAAHGSTDPVEKEIIVDVDPLYGESTLNIRNLDYYSDLQAADSVNINHLLLPSTISADLDGDTYTQVTVLTNTGTTVSGGAYAAKMKTTEVSADFITTDNADNGYQLKVEIWTIPDSPAEFDAFYKNTTTEMTTHVDGTTGITYTTGQTKTIAGNTYTSATVMIPIRYFFKEVWDEEEQANVLQFDSTKQNFYLYSSLELGYEYEITYTYPSKIWKGDQAYKVTGYFTADEFQLLNAARNGFNSETDKKTFIYSKAPYEDNYRQVLSWNCSSATVNVDSNNAKKLIIGVATTAEKDTDVNLTIQLPLAATLTGEGTDDAKFEPTLTDGKVMYVEGGFTKSNIVLTYMTHPRYSINGVKEQIADEVYLQAPQSVVKTVSGEQKDVYFSYWSLKDQETGSEYARCYSQNLNSAFYKDTVAEAVYENESKEAFDNRVPTDNDKTAKIEILEQSRNQWTDKLSTNAAWDSADRLISDYLLTFTYNGKTIKNISGMKYGILFESAGDLDVDATTGEYITDSAHYSAKDDADAVRAAKAEASTFLNSHDSSGGNYLLSIKNASTMDNKNQVEYAYTIAGNNELHRELKYYRVYAFLKTSTGEITISDPIYLTIYDVASIQNGSAEMQSQMDND